MRFKNALLTGLGFFALGLGAVGLFLPLWPTTPFVLVSATCFSSNPRVRARMMRIPFFKEHIENYANRRGISKKTVAISLGYLWASLLISAFLLRETWLPLLLALIGGGVTTHILWMARPSRRVKGGTG